MLPHLVHMGDHMQLWQHNCKGIFNMHLKESNIFPHNTDAEEPKEVCSTVRQSMQPYPQNLRGWRKKLTYPVAHKESFSGDFWTEAMFVPQAVERQNGGSLHH